MRGTLLVVAVLVAGCGSKKETPVAAKPQEPAGPEPELTVAAEQLFRDYRDGDPKAADAKYVGKVVKVRGRVHAVEPNGDGFLVGVETGPTTIGGSTQKAAVVGAVGASAKEAVGKMKPGDDVVLIGKCGGKEADEARKGGIKITLADARVDAHYPR